MTHKQAHDDHIPQWFCCFFSSFPSLASVPLAHNRPSTAAARLKPGPTPKKVTKRAGEGKAQTPFEDVDSRGTNSGSCGQSGIDVAEVAVAAIGNSSRSRSCSHSGTSVAVAVAVAVGVAAAAAAAAAVLLIRWW